MQSAKSLWCDPVTRTDLCLQSLQERFGGWNSSQVVEPFRQYARTMFAALGGHVKHWTTMNEPQTFCFNGYSSGGHAPGIRDTVCLFWALAAIATMHMM